jgi:hypothetical protein
MLRHRHTKLTEAERSERVRDLQDRYRDATTDTERAAVASSLRAVGGEVPGGSPEPAAEAEAGRALPLRKADEVEAWLEDT